MKLDANKIMQNRIAKRLGLEQYKQIMQKVRTVDVSTDADFQRLFNGYYIIRRNLDWRNIYYTLFKSMKVQTATFQEIITTLYDKTGNVEASFSSKMLATLYPDHPIWDQYVVRNLDFRLTGTSSGEKLENAIALYSDIEKWYAQFLGTEDANECIAVFDRTLPDYTWLSSVKKVDFFLWSSQ